MIRSYYPYHHEVKAISQILALLSILMAASGPIYGQSEQKSQIEDVQNDHLTFRTYERKDVKRLDLLDVIISAEIIGKGDPLHIVFDSAEPDIKLELIRAGLAELRVPATASEDYKSAQEKAMAGRKGIWAKKLAMPSPSPPESGRSEKSGNSFWIQLWRIAVVFGTLGITTIIVAIIGYLIKRWWFRRPVHLLVLGEVSAGKTAISERLLNPNVALSKLRILKPSQAIVKNKKRAGIPKGEYVIIPQVEDIPGSFYGSVWDALILNRFVPRFVWRALTFIRFFPPRVWLFVVAPTPGKMNTDEKISVDQDYVSVQLGIVKAQVMGGLDSDLTIKPKAVVLFMNKFDLFSPDNPDDKAASHAKELFEDIFSKHNEVLTKATNRRKIDFYPVVGSAFNSWNCARIIDYIGESLYGS